MARLDSTKEWVYLNYRLEGCTEIFRQKLMLADITNIAQTVHETLGYDMTEIVTCTGTIIYVEDSFEDVDTLHQEYLIQCKRNMFLKMNN